ncbi:hypothetical protein XELAEV_18000135mg [Xenopus laevis]|uniref:Uncharacterized protein n=1 Tax=Xenopus laevis TaxID=8355 RepID=A0A974BQP7_XENLA|nr:hypothetical protein XELAEV_18000135mg [Xenopus laevis]
MGADGAGTTTTTTTPMFCVLMFFVSTSSICAFKLTIMSTSFYRQNTLPLGPNFICSFHSNSYSPAGDLCRCYFLGN